MKKSLIIVPSLLVVGMFTAMGSPVRAASHFEGSSPVSHTAQIAHVTTTKTSEYQEGLVTLLPSKLTPKPVKFVHKPVHKPGKSTHKPVHKPGKSTHKPVHKSGKSVHKSGQPTA